MSPKGGRKSGCMENKWRRGGRRLEALPQRTTKEDADEVNFLPVSRVDGFVRGNIARGVARQHDENLEGRGAD